MLGLSGAVRACVFDLERVLTDSASLHAWAWGEVFDDFLLRFSQQTGRHFIPFDRVVDYRSYVDGRPRLEGVHAFLQSRGIRLPEGWTDDSPEAETANGLARRKGALLASRLRERGVAESPGARRFLEAAHRAGDKCAAISASANTSTVLELTGLAALIDVRVDAEVMRSESLRALPAPDLLLAACRGLAVLPAETAIFTCSPAAVVAGRSAGLAVIGIGDGEQAELLTGFGAERVVPSLRTLLDPRLLGPGDDPTAVGFVPGPTRHVEDPPRATGFRDRRVAVGAHAERDTIEWDRCSAGATVSCPPTKRAAPSGLRGHCADTRTSRSRRP